MDYNYSGTEPARLSFRRNQAYERMTTAGTNPNSFTFSSVLKACGSLASTKQERCIHGCVIEREIMDKFVRSSLLDIYAKCGIVLIIHMKNCRSYRKKILNSMF